MNSSSLHLKLNPIMIMAGGTGGHIFPALAVARALRANNCPVVWMGAPDSMESKIVTENNIPLRTIDISGVRGKGLKAKLMLPIKLFKAILQARRIIKKEQPAAVLGFGGFVTGPGGLASWILRKPLLVHEQNAVAGMTNRYLAKVAHHVYAAFPNSFASKAGVECIGNPMRKTITDLYGTRTPNKISLNKNSTPKLLIIGGSLGAKALNETVPSALALLHATLRPRVTHQAGKRTLHIAQEAYVKANVDANVVEFIDDMAAAYQAADLIICRAGALTVSEVTAAGLPAIFVPYPHAVDDHQRLNAKSVADVGGAIVMIESALTPESLARALTKLLKNQAELNAMSQNSQAVAKLDAVEIITNQCLQYAAPNIEVSA